MDKANTTKPNSEHSMPPSPKRSCSSPHSPYASAASAAVESCGGAGGASGGNSHTIKTLFDVITSPISLIAVGGGGDKELEIIIRYILLKSGFTDVSMYLAAYHSKEYISALEKGGLSRTTGKPERMPMSRDLATDFVTKILIDRCDGTFQMPNPMSTDVFEREKYQKALDLVEHLKTELITATGEANTNSAGFKYRAPIPDDLEFCRIFNGSLISPIYFPTCDKSLKDDLKCQVMIQVSIPGIHLIFDTGCDIFPRLGVENKFSDGWRDLIGLLISLKLRKQVMIMIFSFGGDGSGPPKSCYEAFESSMAFCEKMLIPPEVSGGIISTLSEHSELCERMEVLGPHRATTIFHKARIASTFCDFSESKKADLLKELGGRSEYRKLSAAERATYITDNKDVELMGAIEGMIVSDPIGLYNFLISRMIDGKEFDSMLSEICVELGF